VSISSSEKIRSSLSHPIIDTDGHTVELTPVYLDYIKQIGGGDMVGRYIKATANRGTNAWHGMSEEERKLNWSRCPPWWARPTRTVDRATASLPKLLYERMGELGFDFTVLYPTEGSGGPPHFNDPELRQVTCRALNTFHKEIYGPYADRITIAAEIPFQTPEEALREIDFAVNELGFKVIVFSLQKRPIPLVEQEKPELANHAYRLDTFGLDSDFDYDPVWKKCIDLNVVPTSHSGGQGWGSRQSISNYMYNHIGHFAAASEALCKSFFMGGVTRRYPNLNVAFLEAGVGWACLLYADMIGHWEKRGAKGIHQLNPSNMDDGELMALIEKFGDERVQKHLPEIKEFFEGSNAHEMGDYRAAHELWHPENIDDWALCKIENVEDIKDLFVPNFYFGCEADDPTVSWAFDTKVNPLGARLKAMLSSDIGHWDVPDMREVVAEAYELVEDGLISEDDFRDFAFTNAASLYTGMNPKFFEGTACEAEAKKVVSLKH